MEKLKELIKKAKGITSNSKEVQKGFIFVAIRGNSLDGHDFIEEAFMRGASLAIGQKDLSFYKNYIKVEDSKKTLGELLSYFYGEPYKEVKVIGVTGTNGKTSTTNIINEILNVKEKSGLIGTISYKIGDNIIKSKATTPRAEDWFWFLDLAKKEKTSYVVAEVSSHALDQKRVYPTEFFSTIFTNLTQDHLDYHKTMENYFNAKKLLFTEYKSKFSVINIDDFYGQKLLKNIKQDVITYGKNSKDIKILSFEQGAELNKLELEIFGKKEIFYTNLYGNFQSYNIAASIAFSVFHNIDKEVIREGLLRLKSVPGRFETIKKDDILIVIDYAHTPDALLNVLNTINSMKKNKVITVFGAGGNRDKTKRPLMGKIAKENSDIVIVTSDNPRFEDPIDIINDILTGIENKENVYVEPDREKAIKLSLDIARQKDIILIAGKGHEDYQEIKGVKHHFSDKEVVLKSLSK